MIGQLLAVLDRDTVRGYRAQIRRSVAYAVLEGLAVGLTLPTLAAIIEGDSEASTRWLILLALATALALAAHAWTVQKGTRATFDAMAAVQVLEIEHLRTLPLDWFTPSRNAEVLTLLWPGAISTTRNILLNLAALARGIVTPVIVVVFAALVSPTAAVVMGMSIPLLYLVHRVTTRHLEAAEHVDHAANTEATARIIEYAESQTTLRSADRNNLGMALLTSALDDLDKTARRGVRSEIAARTGFGTAVNIAVAAIVLVVGIRLLDNPTDIATLIALSTLALRFAEPVMTVAAVARMLRTSSATVTRTVDFLTTPSLSEPVEPQTLPEGEALSIQIDDVDVRYDSISEPALSAVNFDVPLGSTVAIVGASGAGKSTLLRLIPRFADPTTGAVRIGGVDVRDISSADLHTRIGVIMPEVVLLDRTIRDNVTANRPDANQDELDRVATLSGLDEVIARIPGGWNAQVGPRGTNLSGGERQRVQIARVALQNPSIVILDEATAALDPLSERIVQKWVSNLHGRCTVVIVAHRLHTIATADYVVVLEGGEVIESGTPADLAEAGGQFHRMINTRTDTSQWRSTTQVRLPHKGGVR